MRYLTIFLVLLAATFSVAAESVKLDAKPDFELQDLDGKTYRISDFRGKWVVVNYWATWCPPCLEEMPELDLFHNTHKDKLAVVLGVNFEDIGDKKLRTWVDEQFLSFPILRDTPRAETVFGKVHGLPSTYVINPDGEYVARQVGQVTSQMLEDFILSNSAPAATQSASAATPD